MIVKKRFRQGHSFSKYNWKKVDRKFYTSKVRVRLFYDSHTFQYAELSFLRESERHFLTVAYTWAMFRMIGETALGWHESHLLMAPRHFGMRERQDKSKGYCSWAMILCIKIQLWVVINLSLSLSSKDKWSFFRNMLCLTWWQSKAKSYRVR